MNRLTVAESGEYLGGSMRSLFGLVLAALYLFVFATPAQAQPVIGQCNVPPTGKSFLIRSNLWVEEYGNPANAGFAARDPSGQSYIRLPSTNPAAAAYFVAWNGQLWEFVWTGVANLVGSCSISVPPPPPIQWPVPSPDYGVPVPGGLAALPAPIVNPAQPFGLPLIATQGEAQQCAQDHSDASSDAFKECMVKAMLGKREEAVFDCTRKHSNPSLLASCTVGALGGQKERQIAAEFQHCYEQANGSYQALSLCMAGQQFDGDKAILIRCMSQQAATTGNVSAMGTAVCYGAAKLDLNPEVQIVMQCAVATNGQPKLFAACAGGALTARELAKCETHGIGTADGCFGPNNDIIKYLNSGGVNLVGIYGEGHTAVKKWNEGIQDILSGNRDAGIKKLRDGANAAAAAATAPATEAYNLIKDVMPRVTVGKPSVTIGGRKFSL